MSRKFKKLTAVVMAGVMAVSMAVTANADECAHLSRSLKNKRLSDHSISTHYFNLYNSKGEVVGSEKCIISYQTFEYTYVCNSCNVECGTYYEHTKTHTNSKCPGD